MTSREQRLAQDGAVNPVLFFGGRFSNFSAHPVVLPSPWDGELIEYRTSEHRFQAMKAITPDDHNLVAFQSSASDSKKAGRNIMLRPDWGDDSNTICWFVMLEALIYKTVQHSDVRNELRSTGKRIMYEDSPTDDLWGWRHARDHSGKNLLGRCWMQVRDLLYPI